jgi:hypothetical protein
MSSGTTQGEAYANACVGRIRGCGNEVRHASRPNYRSRFRGPGAGRHWFEPRGSQDAHERHSGGVCVCSGGGDRGGAAPVQLRQEARHQGLETASDSYDIRSGLPAEPSRDGLHLQLLATPCHLSSQRMVNSIDQRIAISRRETGEPACYRQSAAILHDLLGVHPRFCHVSIRAATLDAGSRLDQDQIREPFADWRRIRSAPRTVTLAFDGGYARRTRKGPRRNFEILTETGEIDRKIWVFAIAHKAVVGLKRRLAAFVSRLHFLGTADCLDDRRCRIPAEA